MAEKPKQNTRQAPKKPPHQRRRTVAGVAVIVAGLLALLSILSYSRQDAIVLARLSIFDIFRLPFNDGVKELAGELHNRLGLIGSFVADFFINGTIGYASAVIPVLMVLWGWVLLRRKEFGTEATLTNYALLIGVLSATAFGTANLAFGGLGREWSGVVGAFAADAAKSLLGIVGSSIVLAAALFLAVVLAIDLDIHRSIDRAKSLWAALLARIAASRERRGEHVEIRGAGADEAPAERDLLFDDVGDDPPGRFPAPPAEGADEGAFSVVRGEPAADAEPPDPGEELYDEPPGLPAPAARAPKAAPAPPAPAGGPAEGPEAEIDYVFPSVELLDAPRQQDAIPEEELKANAELVRAKLGKFGVEIESVSVTPGPVVTLYELVPASGVKISRIVSLADDLALALAAKGIRIMAPIPGKSAVGVEIPNRNPSLVHLRSVLNSTKFRESRGSLPIALGKTISGDVYTDDLARMPHLLIAGSTGSGKSVGINTILAGILFRLHPSEVKFIIIDPKKIELAQYGRLKHHFLAVSPDLDQEIVTSPENAVNVLKGVESEMEKRYDRLAAAGVRNIQDYNERLKAGRLKAGEDARKMPYLVVVIDELADLMMTAAREVEEPIARLAQLARAVGVHLVLATQRPSVDVITGVIKANFPARIAYQVASKIDSRTILDMNGAEQLLGSGDMLYLPAGSPKPVRIQNAFISTDEVERLTEHIARQQGYATPFMLPSILERRRGGGAGGAEGRDEFFEEAARLIVRHQQGSVSLLQRRLKVGYSRAARIVDELEAAGIVGPFDGSKARLVLIETDEQLDRILDTLA